MARGRGAMRRGTPGRRDGAPSAYAWAPGDPPLALDEWDAAARALLQDPAPAGSPRGEGAHDEVILPLRLEDMAGFARRFDIQGDERVGFAGWTYGRSRDDDGVTIFIVGRIAVRPSARSLRMIGAAFPLVHFDEMARDDELDLQVAQRALRVEVPESVGRLSALRGVGRTGALHDFDPRAPRQCVAQAPVRLADIPRI